MFPLLAVVVPRPPAVTPLPPVVVPGLPAVPPIFPAVFVPAGFPAEPVFVRPFTVVFVRVLVEVPILPVVLVPVLPVFMVLAWPVEPGVVRVFVFVWVGAVVCGVVCCVGADGRLGAELCAGALAWGAGALGRGAGAFLCWAQTKTGTTIMSATKTCLRRALPFIVKFITDS